MAERDWRDVLDAQMASRENRMPRRSIAVNYPMSLYPLVQQAARERDMSMTAYQRRAALAFAQWDLQFDWLEKMADEPPITSFVTTNAGRRVSGLGYGEWQIMRLDAWQEDAGD